MPNAALGGDAEKLRNKFPESFPPGSQLNGALRRHDNFTVNLSRFQKARTGEIRRGANIFLAFPQQERKKFGRVKFFKDPLGGKFSGIKVRSVKMQRKISGCCG